MKFKNETQAQQQETLTEQERERGHHKRRPENTISEQEGIRASSGAYKKEVQTTDEILTEERLNLSKIQHIR